MKVQLLLLPLLVCLSDHVPRLFQGDILHDDFVDFAFRSSIRKQPRQSSSSSSSPNYLYRDCPRQQRRRGRRAAVAGNSRLWPGGVVYYEFDASVAPSKRVVIGQAMRHWEASTCIRFELRTSQYDYLSFYNGPGCFTAVGRSGGRQGVSINDGCKHMGTIAHELAHALGFWHEQSRPDRDASVEVLWANIEPGREHNFNKMDYTQVDSRAVLYDYGSIMHYGPYSFAVDQTRPTIRARNETDKRMGQRSRLSALDIEQAGRMYCCPGGVCASDNPCERGLCSESIHPPYYRCSCFQNWYGVNCSVSNDRCATQPCSNGVCVNGSALGFVCECDPGYEGLLCDQEIDECRDAPCANGGACQDRLLGFTCECKQGFRGERCQYLECPRGMFGCRKRNTCVSSTTVCDFNNDCGDWSDEAECGACEFEGGQLCGWVNGTERWQWRVSRGSTATQGTGPDMDYTTRSPQGGYLLVEAAETGGESVASITSPTLKSSSQSCHMEMAFHMYGEGVGTLVVKLRDRLQERELFRISGNQGRSWHITRLDVGKHFFFTISISALRGSGITGDMAIDDVKFSGCETFEGVNDCAEHDCVHGQCLDGVGTHACQCLPGYVGARCDEEVDECSGNWCSEHGTCEDLVNGYRCICEYGFFGEYCDIAADFICDFEEGLCEPWRHSEEGEFQWQLGVGHTPSKGTGPSVDATSGRSSGHYLYMEGSSPQSSRDRAILEMGPLSHSERSCLLSFSYHMLGDTMGSISVQVVELSRRIHRPKTLWSMSGDQGSGWHTAIIPMVNLTDFRVMIVGQVGTFWQSDGALDDLMLSGRCGVIDPCIGVKCSQQSYCQAESTTSYQCVCKEGWAGPDCSVRVSRCRQAMCGDWGVCVEDGERVSCRCYEGWTGPDCSDREDECKGEDPCVYGVCRANSTTTGVECDCWWGYRGRLCEVMSCEPNPCLSGGQCTELEESFHCACVEGYEGELCEVEPVIEEVIEPTSPGNSSLGDGNKIELKTNPPEFVKQNTADDFVVSNAIVAKWKLCDFICLFFTLIASV